MRSPKETCVSILIVNYNRREDLERCLHSIYAAEPDVFYQIVVVDNASNDGSVAMIKGSYPTVVLIENENNVGLVKAYNQALTVGDSKYVMLLDSDTIVEEGAVSRQYAFLDGNPDVTVLQPKLLNSDGTNQKTARMFPSPANALFGRHSILSRRFPRNPWTTRYLRNSLHESKEPYEVDWVSFACTMFRRSILDHTGFFDEDYFVYWIDADWCKRVKDAGGRVFCLPSATVHHLESNQPHRKKTPRSIVDFHHGVYLFYTKHYVKSVLHPMRWAAGLGLSFRALLLLSQNQFKPSWSVRRNA
ncbi:MAG: glycosyltransferase [Chitinivibrionales bacterium]|nr:glycosyltransferase [Chitinivibrionales bacterium]MBD3358848.1 glycosyltransferase [Chitinivibrionales bacterium]